MSQADRFISVNTTDYITEYDRHKNFHLYYGYAKNCCICVASVYTIEKDLPMPSEVRTIVQKQCDTIRKKHSRDHI